MNKSGINCILYSYYLPQYNLGINTHIAFVSNDEGGNPFIYSVYYRIAFVQNIINQFLVPEIQINLAFFF